MCAGEGSSARVVRRVCRALTPASTDPHATRSLLQRTHHAPLLRLFLSDSRWNVARGKPVHKDANIGRGLVILR